MTLQLEHPPIEENAEEVEPTLYRLSVDQYEAMSRAGILTEADKVELLEGMIVKKMTKNDSHIVTSLLFTQLFPSLLPSGWILSLENPTRTFDSLPEPDVMIVRGKPRDFVGQRITPDKIGLLVEISDATLKRDRGTKMQVYARGGIVTYWIINLNERQIEVFTQPYTEDQTVGYKVREVFTEVNEIPFILDGQEITKLPVRDLLP